jgi:hypothetical protein
VDCGEATTIDEMMEWVYFKIGTYWIYQEQNTGATDTCTVYFSYSGTSQAGNREFLYKIHSSFDGYTYEYWFNDGWSSHNIRREGCPIRVVDCDKYIPGDYLGGTHVFPFPLFVGNTCGQDNGVVYGLAEIVNIRSQDTLYNSVFTNTVEVHQECSPQHAFHPSSYKIVKNIGIIQKKVPHLDQDWILMSKHIIQ